MWRRSRASSVGLAAGAALAVSLMEVGGARAETIDATSTTLVSGMQDPRDGVVHTALPVYEMVSVRATDFHLPGVDDMTVVMSGWGAIALADPLEGQRGLGDLDVAFVEGKLLHRRVTVRLGRQLLFGGAGWTMAFDGLTVTARPWRWVGVSAEAGVPVTPRFGADRGDALVGGRAFVKPAFDGEAGVSFLQVLDNGEIARRDLALDGRVVPTRALALSALAVWSLPDSRLAEGHLSATWQLGPRLEVSGDYRRTAPDLFLPRNSIFAVFAEETRDEAGGYLYVKLAPRLRLQGDYHVIVDATGTGYDTSAKLTDTFGLDGRHPTTAGIESRRLAFPTTGYAMERAFAQVRISPRVVTTFDASAFFFDVDVNGQDRSYVAAATLAYDFRPGWRGVVTGIGSSTPFVERSFEGMAKVVYQSTTQVRQVRP
jgi:hypothetical protein